MKSTPWLTAAAALVALALSGCAPTVALHPAAAATSPACASVTVHLPSTVNDLAARETNAQATGAWGTPSSVLLHCGVAVPDPTSTLECITVEGIDWLADYTKDPVFVFTTYGRSPAVQVVVDSRKASGEAVLTDLALAVGEVRATHHCVAPTDTLKTPTATPTPDSTVTPSVAPTRTPTPAPTSTGTVTN